MAIDTYGIPNQWALGVFLHYEKLDGIYFQSRFSNDFCVALFDNAPAVLRGAGSPRGPLWPAPCRRREPAAARRLAGATLFLQLIFGRTRASAAGVARVTSRVSSSIDSSVQ